MATYYRGRPLNDTKFIVHPHYATQFEASNEAIGHQVRHIIDSFIATYFAFVALIKTTLNGCDQVSTPTYRFAIQMSWIEKKDEYLSVFNTEFFLFENVLFVLESVSMSVPSVNLSKSKKKGT